MIELILLANLFVLILVLMMLRTWLPLLKKLIILAVEVQVNKLKQ